MYSEEELVMNVLACHKVNVHEPPPGLISRLLAAIAWAEQDGRGKISLSDFDIQFVTVDPGMRGSYEVAVIEHKGEHWISDDPIISDYTNWMPVDDEGTPFENYDCWVVVNRMLKLVHEAKVAA